MQLIEFILKVGWIPNPTWPDVFLKTMVIRKGEECYVMMKAGWNSAAASLRMPEIASNCQKLGRTKKGFSLQVSNSMCVLVTP